MRLCPTNKGERASGNPDDKRADDARSTVKGRHASDEADYERQGMDDEREDQPAEEADAEHAEDESDDEHGGNLRDESCDGRALHHHRGAIQSIAKDGPEWESEPGPAGVP